MKSLPFFLQGSLNNNDGSIIRQTVISRPDVTPIVEGQTKGMVSKSMRPDRFEIRFFPVGDKTKGGDAILIQLFDFANKKHVVLIDGGYWATGKQIISYLKKCSVEKIDYVISTHFDNDHIGGIGEVISSDCISCGTLIMNDYNQSCLKYVEDQTQIGETLNESLEQAKNIRAIAQQRGIDMIHPCGLTNPIWDCLYILGPSQNHMDKYVLGVYSEPVEENVRMVENLSHSKFEKYDSTKEIQWDNKEKTSGINETSIVVALKLGDLKFLFTGDVGKEGLNAALDKWESMGHLASEFTHIQLPHHGSRKNIDLDIIRRLHKDGDSKKYLISCPPQNPDLVHPSHRLINKIYEISPKSEIYCTAGKFLIVSKGMFEICSPAKSVPICPIMDAL